MEYDSEKLAWLYLFCGHASVDICGTARQN